jgi:NodT family efflux transporter outer membrane factor (OMF) lipoprotein
VPVADLQQWAVAHPSDDAIGGAWWTLYDDPVLAGLAARVAEENQSLAASAARLEQARAASVVARAGLFPSVTAGGATTRQRQSDFRPNRGTTSKGVYSDDTLHLDLSYELDFWGRVRNQAKAGEQREQASAADYAAVTLALQTELATDYFLLRGADSELALLRTTVEIYGRALGLVQKRFDGGTATRGDVAVAQAQLENARTAISEAQLRRTQAEHAIAVLVGESASSFKLAVAPDDDRVPALDPGLPSTLLERRPDIAGAERRVAAANADIGVARAAWFPRFSLAGLLGFESDASSRWIQAPARYWSVGPQVAQTVFDAGRTGAQVDQAKAIRDELAANYRNTVLVAYREVEDQLIALRLLEQESKSQGAAVEAAQRALQQILARYQGGLSTFLDVVVIQNTALQSQRDAINIRTRRLNASVQLVKALGGGWKGMPSG